MRRRPPRNAVCPGMSETICVKGPASFLGLCCLRRVPIVAGMGRLFADAETIHAEKEILRRMEQGQNRAAPIMPIPDAVPTAISRPTC
jgi:hypothetical protein